jgi:hypothetical protein
MTPGDSAFVNIIAIASYIALPALLTGCALQTANKIKDEAIQ